MIVTIAASIRLTTEADIAGFAQEGAGGCADLGQERAERLPVRTLGRPSDIDRRTLGGAMQLRRVGRPERFGPRRSQQVVRATYALADSPKIPPPRVWGV